MKFGKQFEFHKIPEWSEYYIEYNFLKADLKDILTKFSNIQESDENKNEKENFQNKKYKNNGLTQPLIEDSNFLSDFSINSLKESSELDQTLASEIILASTEIVLNEVNNLQQSFSKEECEFLMKNWVFSYENQVQKAKKFFQEKLSQINKDFSSLKNGFDEKTKPMKFNTNSNISNNLLKLKEGDELGYAVSWKRAFSNLYFNLNWLQAFLQINNIASQKIHRLFYKNTNHNDKFSTLEKNLDCITLSDKSDTDLLLNIREQVLILYAESFFNNSKEKAADELHNRMKPMLLKDIALIFFYIGLILCLSITTTMMFSINSKSFYLMRSYLPSFLFSLMLILCFFGVGINIYIFKKYRINYLYIFEIEPAGLITYEKIFKTALFLLVFWNIFLLLTYLNVNFNFYESKYLNIFLSDTILAFLLLFFLCPFHCFYLTFRKSIFSSLVNNFFPVGKLSVRFRDFILGDILTSLTRPFQSLYLTICYTTCVSCINEGSFDSSCRKDDIIPLILTIFPFVIRFFQCVNRYYYTKASRLHIANCVKYFCGMFTSFLLWDFDYFNQSSIIIGLSIFGTLYLIYWDICMDWDLGYFDAKYFLLREKLTFQIKYYYLAILLNVLLRFTWLINIYLQIDDQLKMMIFSFLEIFRRIFWTILRVENENQNNSEKYRSIVDVPELPLY